MAETTGIEWADRTFSPWEGCQKAGPGCDNCYAEARNGRFLPKDGSKPSNWGPGAPRRVMSDSYWAAPWAWNETLGAAGQRESVFPSLCDPFDKAAPAGQRERFANLILGTPNLEWLLLTKRIGNVVEMLAEMFPNGAPPNIRIGATIVTPRSTTILPRPIRSTAHAWRWPGGSPRRPSALWQANGTAARGWRRPSPMRTPPSSPPAIVIQADRFDVLRCRCPVCITLDAQHPGEGFQLALFPYRIARGPRIVVTR